MAILSEKLMAVCTISNAGKAVCWLGLLWLFVMGSSGMIQLQCVSVSYKIMALVIFAKSTN